MKYEKLIPGMVSVTFRGLSPEKITDLSAKSGLKAIEWGSDVHLKASDFETACKIAKGCNENGILPISYGSYQGKGEDGENFFAETVATAERLGAGNIRIWAGNKNSEDMSEKERKAYASYAGRLADMAAEKDIDISFECHRGTLTNTPESAVRLIEEIGRKNVCLYWQPLQSENVEKNKSIIRMLRPYLKNVHVFAWTGENNERHLLKEHENAWREYAEEVSKDGKEHGFLLEFVKNDSEDVFRRDAETLLKIVGF